MEKEITGIVLHRTAFQEADWVVQILTPMGGKKSLLARGARKSVKRFGGGVLEPTHFIRFQYKEPRQEQGLGTLLEAHLLEGFSGLRTDYEKLSFALHMVDSVRKVAQDDDISNEGLFDLLGNGLQGLQSSLRLSDFKLHFMLRLLSQQGVLEIEPWMAPWLKISLRDSSSLSVSQPSQSLITLLETQFENYIR